jgi:hypothetical protein
MIIVFFSRFKICHLVAQIVDWVKMAQMRELTDPGITNFGPPLGNFDPEKLL